MRLALYQPDIASNACAIFRLAAVLGVKVDLIEPAGFVMTDRRLQRVGMDYLNDVEIIKHTSWESYSVARNKQASLYGRVLLLTTSGDNRYSNFDFS